VSNSYSITCPIYAAPPVPKAAPAAHPTRHSKYDAAGSGSENRVHWSYADDLSANAAASPEVRRTLRRRARYERDNDPHINGLTKQLAYDLVGTGPRLQLQLGEEYETAARLVEQSFAAWCRACDLADKLRVLHEARPTDGESFGQFITNPALPNPVKLDLRTYEAEQVASPWGELTDDVDGIRFDASGNPTAYHVLSEHPGDTYTAAFGEGRWVPARYMVHWFRPSRPGQARGVSELASALAISSQTRRYSQAVLSAAEFAASIAGVMYSTLPPADGPVSVEAMDPIEVPRAKLLTLPEGWQAGQLKAEQPTGTHNEFVDGKRADQARPLGVPRNVMLGNSSQYNFSSGRLDHVPYHRTLWIERDRFRNRVVDRLFLAWVQEAQLVGLIPDALPALNLWTWDWHWDGFGAIDPVKETQASVDRINAGLSTLQEENAADGKDWRDVLTQKAREKRFAESLGLTLTTVPAPPNTAAVPTRDAPAEDPADV
jgi:lambda family phage portal protein